MQHALEPLVYRPGPHQTADRDAWRLESSTEILDLKVADIACGSGAFLVAAARYLAARLVEAWHAEGVATVTPARAARRSAIRKVVAHCLYGADINAMAVEMCKLSLWLVSLDPKLPFSFVDDKVLHGNSLLGLTDVRQLEALHIDPPTKPLQALFDFSGDELVEHLDVDDRIQRAIRCGGGSPPRSTSATRSARRTPSGASARVPGAHRASCGRRRRRHRRRAARSAASRARRSTRRTRTCGSPSAAPSRRRRRAATGRMLDAIIDEGLTPTVADRLRAMEAAALGPRGAGRHGARWLRRRHRQPAVPRRQEDHAVPWAPTSATGSSTCWRTGRRATLT